MPGDLSDGELVRRCRLGRAEAWEEMLQRYGGLVRRVLSGPSCSFGADDVDDLLQEVLIKLHGGLARFGGRCSLKTFVVAITKQVAIDAHRRRGALKRGAGRDIDELLPPGDRPDREPASPDPGPEQQAVRAELVAAVRQALHSANDRCRRVIGLYYFEQAPYRAIAETLGSPVNTVASWLARCLTLLRTKVQLIYGEAAWDVAARDF
jgi:RNA polymerase sigma-70 factor, ECF subfamily